MLSKWFTACHGVTQRHCYVGNCLRPDSCCCRTHRYPDCYFGSHKSRWTPPLWSCRDLCRSGPRPLCSDLLASAFSSWFYWTFWVPECLFCVPWEDGATVVLDVCTSETIQKLSRWCFANNKWRKRINVLTLIRRNKNGSRFWLCEEYLSVEEPAKCWEGFEGPKWF